MELKKCFKFDSEYHTIIPYAILQGTFHAAKYVYLIYKAKILGPVFTDDNHGLRWTIPV